MTNEKAIQNLHKLIFAFGVSGELHNKDVQEIIETLRYAIKTLEGQAGGQSDD